MANSSWLKNRADCIIGGDESTAEECDLRARHHTSLEGLKKIQQAGAIDPARGDIIGVHVETEPFGSTLPGLGGPMRETGAVAEGAYVEFDLPADAKPTYSGPRSTAVIPTLTPLSLAALHPKFVKVRRWWNLWYAWRIKT
jgi:hypothetical protein